MKTRIACIFMALLALAAFAQAEVAVGDFVTFGRYEQDNDLENGPEPVEWRVLNVENGEALLVSRYSLDSMPYYTHGRTKASWEKSTLRAWLNSEFLETAFTEEERRALVTRELFTRYDKGNRTTDTVFLLANEDAKAYFANHADRMCTPTAYAVAHGAKLSRKYNDCAHWWLRNPSWEFWNKASFVAASGGVVTCGENSGFVEAKGFTVRPAISLLLAEAGL